MIPATEAVIETVFRALDQHGFGQAREAIVRQVRQELREPVQPLSPAIAEALEALDKRIAGNRPRRAS